MEECGLTVRVLESDSRFPDSVFMEDVALCLPGFAVITNPGAESRRGETECMREVLSGYFDDIREIRVPGRLEAGDVMMAGSHLFIGLSARTNLEGAGQLIEILTENGMSGSTVPLKELLHLKTGSSYLENNNLLVYKELVEFSGFSGFNRFEVSDSEAYAANSLWVNGTVLVPMGNPATAARIASAGYRILELDMSEFRKLDGGLSCLSLRF
jgi:dimethylargininase